MPIDRTLSRDDWPTLYWWCRWPMDAKNWRVLWDGLSCLTLLLVQFSMGHVLRSWCGDRSNLACDTMTDRLCIDGVGDRWMRKNGGCYEMVCLACLCCWCNLQWVMFFVRGVVIDRCLACDTMTDRLCIDGVGDRWMRKIGGCYEMVCLAWLCCWCNLQWVMFFVRGVVIDRTWPVTRWLTDFVLMV